MSTSEQVAARRQKVAELTKQGCSTTHIAGIFSVTPDTIRRDRRALGISQGRAPDLTEQQLDTARRLLADGCSYREASRTIGCAHEALRRHFPGQGWTLSQSASWGMYIRKHAS
ncbi:hypothetical protein [Gordonia sp. WA4-43]|uniref:hypothetical protein n=1 Tax=Gordonia sp. WA4-43 TaxID=2878678 RepID=UPI001CF978DD|nr:hypothetical protein [Gordonia sp. WA4-43]UCZ89045.1 hypothetical protein LEL84_18600 [Gordonia sp. WA4-43]